MKKGYVDISRNEMEHCFKLHNDCFQDDFWYMHSVP
jgi:hypothetical protein